MKVVNLKDEKKAVKEVLHSVLIEQGWCLSCERPMNWCECEYD